MATRLLLAISAALIWANTAQAQGDIAVPFISINEVTEGEMETFNAYVEDVQPVMATHNSGFMAFDVEHVLGGDISPNSVITLGWFGSRDDSIAFSQDPSFQGLFPTLQGATDDHLTVFPNGHIPDAERIPHEGDLLLTLIWTDGSQEDVMAFNASNNARLGSAIELAGGTRLGDWQGMFASQGLGEHMQQTTPPQLMELWHFDDLMAFLQSPEMSEPIELPFNETRGIYLWIKRR